ncbi:putative quinol monooxygenase [Nocardia panacis]|uniref:putative quinol monooxygenase n=1 Tax=Nocardia panacis TaxID=2340916 RepID=UPI0011C43FCD|nr:antibiotic biosynthesis monooxygenase [Nocardia panacis]
MAEAIGEASDRAVIVGAVFTAAPGKAEMIAEALRGARDQVREHEVGNTHYHLARSGDRFIAYERYVSRSAFDEHRRSPAVASLFAFFEREEVLAGPPEIEFYTEL